MSEGVESSGSSAERDFMRETMREMIMEVQVSTPAFKALLAPSEGGVGGNSSTSEGAGNGRTSEGGSVGELVNVTLVDGKGGLLVETG